MKVNAELTDLAPKGVLEFDNLVKFTEEKVVSNSLLIVAKVKNIKNISAFAEELKNVFEHTPYISSAEPFDNPETLIKYGIFTVDENSINNILGYYNAVLNVEPRSVIDFRFWRNLGIAVSVVSNYANEFFGRSGIRKYYLYSKDGEILLMNFSMAKPVTDVDFINEAIPKLKEISKIISKKWNVEILFSGSAMNNYIGNQQVRKDFQTTTIISLIGISLILLLSYGSTSAMLFLFYSMLLSMAISMGIIILLFREINIITSFVNAMLLGLGIDYGIHITAKIHENLRLYGKKRESILEAIKENFVPSLVSAITTSLALLAIALSPSIPLKQMGISSAIGVIVFYLVMNLLIPAFYYKFLNRINIPRREYFSRFIEIFRRFRPLTITVWIILIISSLFVYLAVKNFSYTPPGLVPEDSEAIIALNIATEKFGEFGIGQVVVGAKTFEELKEINNYLENNTKYFSNTFSILNFIQNPERISELEPTFYKEVFDVANEPLLVLIFKKYKLYDSLIETLSILRTTKTFEDVLVNLEKDIPILFFNDLEGNKYFLIYAKERVNLWRNNNLKVIYGNILKDYKVFGYPALFYKVMEYLILSVSKAVYFVFAAILIILIIDQRSLFKAFKISIFVVLSITATVGLGYYVFNIDLTFLNLLIVPIFLGMGVDSMVHLSHSIKYGRESIVKTEKAVTVSVMTTIMAFGSFMAAQGKLLKEFGILVVIGLIVSWFVSIFIYLNSIDKSRRN
ncbi:MAG: MMPL family transporter [Thermosipho sp. (in: Bacteria)]|nr:MMPL family transporter [Thermosipho sp. (in: thermotogales)]